MIKLGIIGTNWITQQFIDAANLTKKYKLVTIYSRHSVTAKKFAYKNHVDEIFTELKDFFLKGSFDTVYIASPNNLHYKQAKLAIKYQKNLIVEKPAFENPQQMSDILDCLKNSDVKYFEAARNIHINNFHLIQDQIKKMSVIQGAEFTYSKYSSRYDKVLAGEEPNVFSLNFAGGALQDLGVYTVYDAIALFGKPKKVFYYPQIISTGVDGKGTAILKYKKFVVVLNFSKISNSNIFSEIYGLKDYISIDDAGEINKAIYFNNKGNKIVLGNDILKNPMFAEAKDFAKVINNFSNLDNQRVYFYWLSLSKIVNQVIYRLRKSAGIWFTDERN